VPEGAEKKSVWFVKVSASRDSGGSKRPSGADILPTKSMKLSKGTSPHVVASTVAACIMPETHISEVSISIRGAKGGERHSGCKTVPGAKVAPSAKKSIVPTIRALAALSSDGTEESSPHDQAPEVQLKADPRGPLMEPQARSATKSGPQPALEFSLCIVPTAGAAGASTSCFWIF
jgi:hypothetical protein